MFVFENKHLSLNDQSFLDFWGLLPIYNRHFVLGLDKLSRFGSTCDLLHYFSSCYYVSSSCVIT